MIFNNNDLPVRLLTLMLAALMCTSMSGCRGTAEVSAGSESTDAHIAESTAVTTQNNIKNSVSSNSDSYLPEGYSMEDLKNMLTINGKSISLPTTPEKIIEILGDGYTYGLDDMGLDLTIDEYFESFGSLPVKILKDNSICLCTLSIDKESYLGDIGTSYTSSFFYTLTPAEFEQCDLKVTLIDTIDFDSSILDVIEVLGEPNNNMVTQDHQISYLFYDKDFELTVRFYLSDNKSNLTKENKIKSFIIKGGYHEK